MSELYIMDISSNELADLRRSRGEYKPTIITKQEMDRILRDREELNTLLKYESEVYDVTDVSPTHRVRYNILEEDK